MIGLGSDKNVYSTRITRQPVTGSGASKVKTGVEYAASWLAPLGFSIVEQISEAAMLDGQVGSLF